MPLHAGQHRAVGPYRTGSRRGGPDHRLWRLYGLAGVVVCAVVLPFAVASAGPSGGGGEEAAVAVPLLTRGGDGKASGAASGPGSGTGGGDRAPAEAAPARSPLPPGPALAARCGPELTSPAGVEAQTCVLARGAETWARTYYRNATGGPLESVLSLIGPGGRSMRTRCAVSAEDAPGTCETPPEGTRGGLAGYTAVAEFASRAGYGPLLLRSGSNGDTGSDGGDGSTEADGSGGSTEADGSGGNTEADGSGGSTGSGVNAEDSGGDTGDINFVVETAS